MGMGVNGIGITGYPAWRKTVGNHKNPSGAGFAERMADVGWNTAGMSRFWQQGESSMRAGAQAAGSNAAMEAYLASSVLQMYPAQPVSAVGDGKPVYETYESENYRIVPDNEAGCFDIYNKQGKRLGVFMYSDMKIRQDEKTGGQFLISEHGTMSYDALALDDELKKDLQSVMGIEKLETEELCGYTLKTHTGTGIQYLLRDGEEWRGGKVLLQNEEDRRQYEALADSYLSRYPNLIESREEALIWADLEIRGMAQRRESGFLSIGYDGMAYHDKEDAKKSWSVHWSRSTFTGGAPGKPGKVFDTFYSAEGITCIREGKRSPENPKEKTESDVLQWEIKLNDPVQYDRIIKFLAEFPQGDNLRFTANEKFWNDFLNDEVDMEGFWNFYAWTDHGEARMNIGENGEQTNLNKERIKDPNAEYFNDRTWIRNVWTEEEMWAQWYAGIEAASAAQRAMGTQVYPVPDPDPSYAAGMPSGHIHERMLSMKNWAAAIQEYEQMRHDDGNLKEYWDYLQFLDFFEKKGKQPEP